jgi:hypothetical protein
MNRDRPSVRLAISNVADLGGKLHIFLTLQRASEHKRKRRGAHVRLRDNMVTWLQWRMDLSW